MFICTPFDTSQAVSAPFPPAALWDAVFAFVDDNRREVMQVAHRFRPHKPLDDQDVLGEARLAAFETLKRLAKGGDLSFFRPYFFRVWNNHCSGSMRHVPIARDAAPELAAAEAEQTHGCPEEVSIRQLDEASRRRLARLPRKQRALCELFLAGVVASMEEAAAQLGTQPDSVRRAALRTIARLHLEQERVGV